MNDSFDLHTRTAERNEAIASVLQGLMQTLKLQVGRDPDLRSDVVIEALGDLLGGLAINSGMLWGHEVTDRADVVLALRDLADQLARRRTSGATKPVLNTMNEVFAASRPSLAS